MKLPQKRFPAADGGIQAVVAVPATAACCKLGCYAPALGTYFIRIPGIPWNCVCNPSEKTVSGPLENRRWRNSAKPTGLPGVD